MNIDKLAKNLLANRVCDTCFFNKSSIKRCYKDCSKNNNIPCFCPEENTCSRWKQRGNEDENFF